jgi:hypothetical protein
MKRTRPLQVADLGETLDAHHLETGGGLSPDEQFVKIGGSNRDRYRQPHQD